jgi:hypothetical protein
MDGVLKVALGGRFNSLTRIATQIERERERERERRREGGEEEEEEEDEEIQHVFECSSFGRNLGHITNS